MIDPGINSVAGESDFFEADRVPFTINATKPYSSVKQVRIKLDSPYFTAFNTIILVTACKFYFFMQRISLLLCQ